MVNYIHDTGVLFFFAEVTLGKHGSTMDMIWMSHSEQQQIIHDCGYCTLWESKIVIENGQFVDDYLLHMVALLDCLARGYFAITSPTSSNSPHIVKSH